MFSIAAHGHVNPSLEVIRELVARGHRVTYAIPPAFAGKVAETGAEPQTLELHAARPDDDPDAWGTSCSTTWSRSWTTPSRRCRSSPRRTRATRRTWCCYDITSYPARVLAHRWGVPATPALAEPRGLGGLRGGGRRADVGGAAEGPSAGRAYYARFRAWLEENGIDLDPDALRRAAPTARSC